jgi:hypothetical protein
LPTDFLKWKPAHTYSLTSHSCACSDSDIPNMGLFDQIHGFTVVGVLPPRPLGHHLLSLPQVTPRTLVRALPHQSSGTHSRLRQLQTLNHRNSDGFRGQIPQTHAAYTSRSIRACMHINLQNLSQASNIEKTCTTACFCSGSAAATSTGAALASAAAA